MEILTDYIQLSKEAWSNINLGDKRLDKRAVKIGAAFLRRPFVSPPKMLASFKDIKAFYRFMDSEKVSHDKLVSPHIENTRVSLANSKIVLAVQDTTTVALKRNYDVEGLYDIGNTQGFVTHNCISVIPFEDHAIIDGLLYQIIHERKAKNERKKEDNEIKLWLDTIRAVGNPPTGTTIIDVMDRGADSLEVMHCSKENNHEFILRATYDRMVDDGGLKHLFSYASKLPIAGYTHLDIKGSKRKRRIARLAVSFSAVTIAPPKNRGNLKELPCYIVYVRELQNREPLEWLLFTSMPLNNLDEALTIVRYYSYRWIIEEYHKCMKTGFCVEKTQMETLERIKRLLGFISVSSVKLLQLRDIAKYSPDIDARNYVEQEDIEIIKAYFCLKDVNLSIGRFLRYIAQLGGFLNRNSDGNPGWQSIWEGWNFFMGLREGARLFAKRQTYG